MGTKRKALSLDDEFSKFEAEMAALEQNSSSAPINTNTSNQPSNVPTHTQKQPHNNQQQHINNSNTNDGFPGAPPRPPHMHTNGPRPGMAPSHPQQGPHVSSVRPDLRHTPQLRPPGMGLPRGPPQRPPPGSDRPGNPPQGPPQHMPRGPPSGPPGMFPRQLGQQRPPMQQPPQQLQRENSAPGGIHPSRLNPQNGPSQHTQPGPPYRPNNQGQLPPQVNRPMPQHINGPPQQLPQPQQTLVNNNGVYQPPQINKAPPEKEIKAAPTTYSAAPQKIERPEIGPSKPKASDEDDSKKAKVATSESQSLENSADKPHPHPNLPTGPQQMPSYAGPQMPAYAGPQRPAYAGPQMPAYAGPQMPSYGPMPTEEEILAEQEEEEAAEQEEKKKLAIRHAGGRTWNDSKLAEWDKDDYVIFVGDLGNDASDEMLKRCFGHFASFQKARVVADAKTGKNRGYGFVSFREVNDYARAMKEMNGKYCGNRPMKLKRSSWQQRSYKAKKAKGEIMYTSKRLK